MDLHDFDYDLPPEYIAQTAAEPRDSARLLVLHRANGRLEHCIFRDLLEYLHPGDALVLNQTRVIPARLHAIKQPTGGAIEVLLLERIDDRRWLCWVGGKRARAGTKLLIQGGNAIKIPAEVIEVREGAERVVEFVEPIEPYLSALGELPLPPYIHTPLADPERYQTVYARDLGSVAAPTAGLHFTPGLLDMIRVQGVEIVTCTLHVGPGTFQPVRAEQIADHTLHAEYAELSADAAEKINAVKSRGGRVIAVGTTSVRTLETAAWRALECDKSGQVTSIAERTTLFITPGDPFRIVDAMVTNFHLPRSTLLMLVSAFAGRERILDAYEVAKHMGYRFYSLGDAMLIL
ncbi:MAG: tRNA preQ1(34) S-adenosylmethionine ribosyltransferase-isomerase QueA [Aggregatilineales bacterium]